MSVRCAGGGEGRRKEPPDGGWGWMVVFGSGIAHMFLIPTLQNFTLIFKDHFEDLGFTSTDITTLVSLNASFGMILGLLNGPILKTFGYRKVAFVGLTLYVIGLLLTGIAKTYWEFIVFYGLLSSIGLVMVMASFSLAVNSYFVKNRSKAVGYTMTLMGLGPMFMPFVISHWLASYGLRWTVLLLSGLSLHAFVGVLVLHPLKWHAKPAQEHVRQEDQHSRVWLSDVHSILDMPSWGSRMSLPGASAGPPSKARAAASLEGLEGGSRGQANEERRQLRKLSVTFLDNDDYRNMMSSTLRMIDRMEVPGELAKCASAETLSLDHPPLPERGQKQKAARDDEGAAAEAPGRGPLLRAAQYLTAAYDIDLFHDLLYVNIILGLSLAFAGEVIFSTMTPIILKEAGFSTEETATFVSVIAGCDLLCRFVAPFVGKGLGLNSREMYLMALVMLLISRASMYLTATSETYLLVSFGLGVGKGFRSVFWVLVLPDYVPLSKLPSASAFQGLMNGVLILLSGPVIGAVTTHTKNYFSIVVASNILTLTTIILWCGEIIYLKYKKKYLL